MVVASFLVGGHVATVLLEDWRIVNAECTSLATCAKSFKKVRGKCLHLGLWKPPASQRCFQPRDSNNCRLPETDPYSLDTPSSPDLDPCDDYPQEWKNSIQGKRFAEETVKVYAEVIFDKPKRRNGVEAPRDGITIETLWEVFWNLFRKDLDV